jgi:hypothetical protein
VLVLILPQGFALAADEQPGLALAAGDELSAPVLLAP